MRIEAFASALPNVLALESLPLLPPTMSTRSQLRDRGRGGTSSCCNEIVPLWQVRLLASTVAGADLRLSTMPVSSDSYSRKGPFQLGPFGAFLGAVYAPMP